MTKLNEFRQLGLKITWQLLFLGYIEGNTVFANELTSDEILDYALEVYSNDLTNELLQELIIEIHNTKKVFALLKKLSDSENSCFDIEFRKWRVLFVQKKIKTKNSNFIDGLCELGDMWIKLGYPEDSPFIFQGRKNNISPENYYTKQNYDDMYISHQIWLQNELSFLKSCQ